MVESDTPCGLHVHRRLQMVLFLLYDVNKSSPNAGMPEKVSSESAFLPVLNCLSLVPLSRVSPALPTNA
jgi:hypothetical protein